MIITRKEAKAQGLTQYFTGKPCKNGHLDRRWTIDGTCLTCKGIRNKTWKSNNKHHVLLYQRAWSVTNREHVRDTNRQSYKRNKEAYYNRNQERRQVISSKTLSKSEKSYITKLYKMARARNCHVDHVVPLSKGGLHRPYNLQLVDPEHNLKKGSNLSMEYYI